MSERSAREESLALGRLEGKVDMILQNQANQNEQMADLTARTSSLERGRAWLMGAAAAIGAMSSYFLHTFKG